MNDDLKPPVTSTPVGLIGVSDKDASGYDHKAEALAQLIWETKLAISGSAPATQWDDVKSSPARHTARVVAAAILARFNVTERDEDTSRYRAVNLATGQRTPSWEPGERAQISDWTLWREERFNSATSEWEVIND